MYDILLTEFKVIKAVDMAEFIIKWLPYGQCLLTPTLNAKNTTNGVVAQLYNVLF